MGRDIAQVKKAFVISAVILILIKFSIAWIPFLTYAINPNIDANSLLPYIVDTFSFTGLKGLIIVAIIAFAMSTADSRINASSVLFAHDIYGLFSKDKKNKLLVAKIFGALLGLVTIVLSLVETELLSIIVFSNSFYFPLVSPPFLLSLFGFRSSPKSVLIGMAAGLISTVLWKIVPMEWSGIAQELAGLLFAILCNTVFLFGSHYILRQPGGWVGIKDRTYLEEQKIMSKKKKTDFDQCINNFSIRKICQRIAPHNDITYTTLGVYFIVCTITTMYSTHVELIGANGQLMKIIYPLMLITGTTISMYQIWPLSVPTSIKKNIIETWYPAAIFYMLIFFSCFFVLVSKFAMLQVVLFTTNLIVAALLLGWRLALPSIIIGFFLAINFYQYFFGETGFAVQFGSPEFILIYALLFLSSVVIFFLKPEQEYQEATEVKAVHLEKEVDHLGQKVGHLEFHAEARKKELSKAFELKYEFLRNLQHEAHTPVMGITSMGEVLYECYDKLTDEQRKKYLKDISQSSTRLNSYINNMIDLSKLSSMNYEFHRELINFGELVRERAEICKKLYSDSKYQGKQTIILMLEDNVTGYFDKYYISQVIDNIIINAIQYCKEGEITITLSQTNETIKFSVSDEGIGIPQEDLYDIFGAFTVSSKTKTLAGGRGVGLALCKKIIDLNNGVISAKQNNEKGVTFSFTLPKK
jgi:signal transduction histidine kinase